MLLIVLMPMSKHNTTAKQPIIRELTLDISFLADKTEHLPTIAKWYYEEWGHLLENPSTNTFTTRLEECLNKETFPLVLVATQNNKPIGAAQIKLHQMSIYPNKEHWLAGVYVEQNYRGNKIAASLIEEIQTIAMSLNVGVLHLQTERLSGGLYSNLGWQEDEFVNYRGTQVLVMAKTLRSLKV